MRATRKVDLRKFLAVIGAVCQLALVVALLRLAPTLHGFASAIAVVGIGDPSSLGGAFEEMFDACAVEFTVAFVGLVFLSVVLVGSDYRARWFFRFLVFYGVFLLFVVPVGTAFGIFFLGYCLFRRSTFSAASPSDSTS